MRFSIGSIIPMREPIIAVTAIRIQTILIIKIMIFNCVHMVHIKSLRALLL